MKITTLILALFTFISFKAQSPDISLTDIPSSENLSDTDYEVLNAFFSQVKTYHYVDSILNQKKFNTRFERDFRNNLRLYTSFKNYCNTLRDTEKLKFYCPLADALKKYENAFEEDDFVFFKKKYVEDRIEKKILDLSKIINPKIINQSNDYYSSQKTKILEAPEQRGKTLKIIGIYYTEDKQTAVIAYENSFTDVKGEISFHILKKQKNIWWKSLGECII